MRSQFSLSATRRYFFGGTAAGIGSAALWTLLNDPSASAGSSIPPVAPSNVAARLGAQRFAPRAKRIIYIFQAGGPAQMELWDYKPLLTKLHGENLPASIMGSQRLTGFTKSQGKFPIAASSATFSQRGACGAWVSDLLPHLGSQVDDLCIIRSMHTEAVNHDPALTYMVTGAQQAGRPSLGAWLSYGLGSENANLPAFVVLLSPGVIPDAATPLSARHWGSGFLPSLHQGVKFRSGADPVLYLSNPAGVDPMTRRSMMDVTAELNHIQYQALGDPEIQTRIAQYEMAYRMQTSVPELTDLSSETENVFQNYGPQSRIPGSYASNCLLARRLVESGVRFVQIFDRDWDHHRNTPTHIRTKAQSSDQPTAALLRDLKQRGLLEETLVVCGGEFGRTVYCQGALQSNYGRDHHGGCFTMWLAGGGIRPGLQYGATDDFSFNIVENPVHVHDLNATILRCLGIDHERLTFKFQGRHHRLTDVHGQIVEPLLA
ncbi:MAG: DUF1501 domain-containing protein [Planctomycetales bacterium]|nr:DUF1501 domain-containing protein [Planctomycetales bacterium]